jgi:hypothetical protein
MSRTTENHDSIHHLQLVDCSTALVGLPKRF